MTYTKRFVCLANSRKPPTGRCIAGREVTAAGLGPWIRPVSERPGHEISEEERRYQDGSMPALLDVIDVVMKSPQPSFHQQENHVIDDGYYWVRNGSASWAYIQPAVEDPQGPLWVNGYSSTYGINDRVPAAVANTLTRSLYIVRPNNLRIVVSLEGGLRYPAKRKVRARFQLSSEDYCLSVTDPVVEQRHLAQPDGETPIPAALLCVSLGELFDDGYAYKLAAAVITP